MITKEELKREVDKLPESLLDEAYALLKKVIFRNKKRTGRPAVDDNGWQNWSRNLEKFTPDFMSGRDEPFNQRRESFDE
jgi:hypothetical protein